MFYPNTLTPLTFKLLANRCGRLFGIVLFLTVCFTTIVAQTAYVVRQANDNEVVVIDTSTNLIVATFPSGGEGSFRIDANPNWRIGLCSQRRLSGYLRDRHCHQYGRIDDPGRSVRN